MQASIKRRLPALPKTFGHRGITVLGDATPNFPEDFNRRLQAFDHDLWVVWHHPPTWPKTRSGVWKIEQCIRHNGGTWPDGRPKHDHVCHRIYVMMVQDDEGTPQPLGEHVFSKLREMRANSERYGGETARGLANFLQASKSLEDDMANQRELQRQDIKQHNSRFNRRQLSKAFDLIQRHDVARPNK